MHPAYDIDRSAMAKQINPASGQCTVSSWIRLEGRAGFTSISSIRKLPIPGQERRLTGRKHLSGKLGNLSLSSRTHQKDSM